MKKFTKKKFIWALFAFTITGLITFTAIMQARAMDGPFEAMYDSKAVFLKQVENMFELENNETGVKTDSHKLLEAVSANCRDMLSELEIADAEWEMVLQLYEESLTDRFIVKYKEGKSKSSINDVSGVSVAKTYNISAQATFAAERRKTEIESSTVNWEVLVLNNKIDPSEFAAILKTAGMAAEIETIQPDFILSFAGRHKL